MMTPPRTVPVGILGGMGPAAGADFVRLFVAACAQHLRASGHPVVDQSFPEHWLAQLPVPDRSAALASPSAPQPLEPMSRALGQLAALGCRAVAMACNTAHAWHGALQAQHPQLEILHVAREVARHLQALGVRETVLLATEGTYRTGLYDHALVDAGLVCHLPQPEERSLLMRGIYDGVKAGDIALARECFAAVAAQLAARHGPAAFIMGCTEIPLALPGAPQVRGFTLVDPAEVLAAALAQRAYAT
ncbi:MAG TPA: amino acid racemase [Burkholderiaceae bacterium]